MKKVKIFSVYPIKRELKYWKKNYPQILIEQQDCPTLDSYIIYKSNTPSAILHPIDALIGAQKGYVEGWLKQPFDIERIFQPGDFECDVLKHLCSLQDGEKSDALEENNRLQEVIIELMRKNETLMIENAQLKARIG